MVFRYDADLFYANANRLVDDVEALVENAPDPVRWLVLDASSIADIDYSAGISLSGLLDYLQAHNITFALTRADAGLLRTLAGYGLLDKIGEDRRYGTLGDAVSAFRARTAGRPGELSGGINQ